MPDPTICFLALFSLKRTGEFALPKDVTGPIAKLCRAIHLTMLTELHSLVDSEQAAHQMDAMDMLSPYVHEKEISTFNSLMSLQHYASAIAYQSMSMPRIWWMDRDTWQSMLYQGHEITTAHIHQIFAALEAKIVDIWENKILLGQRHLRINYGVLSDNLMCSDAGYCFLDDERNPFVSQSQLFGQTVFADPALKQKFMHTASGAPQTSFNIMACRKWLQDLAELEGLLMVAVEMKGGSPARGTELTSMLIRNTAYRTRNTMGLGQYLAIIRQYDKTSNNLQADRLIPHAIDAVDGDILIQLHSIIRPFAQVCCFFCFFFKLVSVLKNLTQFLASKVYPEDRSVAKKYAEMLFMDLGTEFSSKKLSQIMTSVCLPVVGWTITISSWRHINIAFKRKLCRDLEDLTEPTTVTATVHALQSGHTPASENRIYGLSPDALLGASEDVLHLFLDASTDWQIVNRIVPGGLALPYQEVRTDHFTALGAAGKFKIRLHSAPTIQATIPLPSATILLPTPAPTANVSTETQMSKMQQDQAALHQTLLAQQQQILTQIGILSQSMLQLQQDMRNVKGT
jgi:hypothetical protein